MVALVHDLEHDRLSHVLFHDFVSLLAQTACQNRTPAPTARCLCATSHGEPSMRCRSASRTAHLSVSHLGRVDGETWEKRRKMEATLSACWTETSNHPVPCAAPFLSFKPAPALLVTRRPHRHTLRSALAENQERDVIAMREERKREREMRTLAVFGEGVVQQGCQLLGSFPCARPSSASAECWLRFTRTPAFSTATDVEHARPQE